MVGSFIKKSLQSTDIIVYVIPEGLQQGANHREQEQEGFYRKAVNLHQNDGKRMMTMNSSKQPFHVSHMVEVV